MICRIDEMKQKQVVDIVSGTVIGFLSDIEFDTVSGNLTSIIIFGRPKALGLFGKEDDITIPWQSIEVIGEETILVKFDKKL